MFQNKSQEKDRRKATRVDYPFKLTHALYTFPGLVNKALEPGKMINISSNGILFESSCSYKAGDLVRIEIQLGSWAEYKTGFEAFHTIYQGEPFIVLGKVLRVLSLEEKSQKFFKAAINYVSVDESHRQAVERFIKKFIQKRVSHENSCS